MSSSSSSPPSFLDKLKAEVKRGEQGSMRGGGSELPAARRRDEEDAAEDSLVYEIYDPQLLRPDASLSPAAVVSQLESLRCSLLSSLSPLLSSYLWHSAPFALSVSSSSSSSSVPPHLRGVTHYGECVDDEYLIASLLLSLSSSRPSLLLRLHDHDGDFLLIDAAHALPPWAASPEHTRNRVWLQAGRLRLLPPSPQTQETLSRAQALQLMMERPETAVSPEEKAQEEAVNSAVLQRLQPYPQLAMTHNSHCVRCLLPLSIARLLRNDATAVSGAVSAFCTRDLIDMRAAHKMQAFLPAASATASSSHSPAAASLLTTIVPCRVRFSRLQYAQLDCQPFTLPRSLLRHPALASFACLPSSSPLRPAFTLGMKLMAGMEMQLHSLRQRQQRLHKQQQQRVQRQQEERRKREQREQSWRAKGGMTEEEAERQMRSDGGKRRRWRRHLEQLQQLGVFRGAKRGSSDWKEKLMTGWLVFEEQEAREQQDSGEQQQPAAGLREDELRHLAAMERVVALGDGDVLELKAEVDQWPQWESLPADDSDDWLSMNEQQLDEIIAQRERADREAGGRSAESQPQQQQEERGQRASDSSGAEAAAVSAAQSMVRGVKDFLATVSGHEGAELPATYQQTKAKQDSKSRSEEKGQHQQSHGARAEDERLHRVMAILRLPEREMLAEMLRYDVEFGQGSFERHLMANAPELGLDAKDDTGEEKKQAGSMDEGGEEEDDEGEEDEEDDSLAGTESLDFEGEAGSLSDYLAAMTRQLQSAGIGQEFERRQRTAGQEQEGDDRSMADHHEEEPLQEAEVDADLNLLSNLLSSVEAQHGQAGPGSTLMSAMGISIPRVTKAEAKAAGKEEKKATVQR